MKYKRIPLIDELRGVAIIGMVIYHFLYSLAYIFNINIGAWTLQAMELVQPYLAGLFILLAGFCCRYSKSNIKRGVKVFLLGLGITVVTVVFIPSQAIYFGILHFMGVSMLLFEAVKRWLDKRNPYIMLFVFTAVFFLTFRMRMGYLALPFGARIEIPSGAYHFWLAPLGLPGEGFASSDYFPLLPWFALFLVGAMLGAMGQNRTLPAGLHITRSRALSAVGKRSLPIYLLHQPLIYLLLWVVLPLIKV